MIGRRLQRRRPLSHHLTQIPFLIFFHESPTDLAQLPTPPFIGVLRFRAEPFLRILDKF